MYRSGVAEVFKIAINNEYVSEDDSRIHDIFNKFSSEGEFMNIEEWLSFYYNAGKENAPVLVSNLINLGYDQLFQNMDTFE